MAYVDLNPVRAAMADSQENSDCTSIQQRIREYAEQRTSADSPRLKTFSAKQKASGHSIAFDYSYYLELTDWIGRCCREDK